MQVDRVMPCIHKDSASQLFEQLVEMHSTHASTTNHPDPFMRKRQDLLWVTYACTRIAREERCSVDDVFARLRGAVKERCGLDIAS